jgi:phosphate transport system substrate-binding protein
LRRNDRGEKPDRDRTLLMKLFRLLLFPLLATIALRGERLVIKGSDTLGAKLVPTLAEEYKAKRPGVAFEIAAEGSTTGISAIIEGTAQIGMSSREAKATEISAAAARGVRLNGIVVAFDGLAVIVNARNPVARLTPRQVEQIFTGDVTDWSAAGGRPGKISVYTRNTSSGTYSDWKDLAMRKRDYARSSQKLAGNEQIVAEVARNPNGIGYVGLAYLNAAGIKVLPINGVAPTRENILGKKYAYARPNFFYCNGEPTGEAARFVEFTLGSGGQAIADRLGFVPAR